MNKHLKNLTKKNFLEYLKSIYNRYKLIIKDNGSSIEY